MQNMLLLTLLTVGAVLAAEGGLDADRMRLPEPDRQGVMPLEQALCGRRSVRRFTDEELSLRQIGQLLWAAQGISDERRGFRTAPSAGATYPLETTLVLPQGVYRYRPADHALERVHARDARAPAAAAALGQSFVREAAAIIVFSSIPGRTTRRYGKRGEMYIHMEVGHAAQNVHLQAVAMGLGSVPVGAFNPARLPEALGLEPMPEEEFLYLIPIGVPAR